MKTKSKKSKLLAVLAAAVACTLVAGPSPAGKPASGWEEIEYPELPEFKIPKPARAKLRNGITILMLPNDDLPLVSGRVLVNVGSRLESEDKVGLASLTGSVLRSGGTASRSADDVDDFLEGIGASVESSIGDDQGRVNFSCLSQDLDAVLELVAEMLREPAFAEDRIDVAKTQEKTGISRRNDNITQIANREFQKLVYGSDSVYARHSEYATIDAVTRDDVVSFHKAFFHPNRTFIGLTGDFTPKAVKKLLKKHFGDWKKGPAAKPFSGGFQTDVKPGVYYVEKTDVNQTNVRIGHLGIRRDNPDYYAITVMNEIFGGGFSSRLFSEVRSNKGLAYAVWGSVQSDYDHPGMCMVGVMTKSETTVEAIRALQEEVMKMRREPPTADEMSRAKSSLLNSFVFNFDTRSEVLNRQLDYLYYGYPLDFLEKYRDEIEGVDAADVNRVANEYLRPDRVVQLVVGKGEDFDAPLSEVGSVTELDVTIPQPAGEAVAAATGQSLAMGKKVIGRAVAKMGGAAALKGMKALRANGEIAVDTPMGKQQMKAEMLIALPDKSKMVMKTPMGDITVVVTPDAAFQASPMGSRDLPANMRDEELKDMRRAVYSLLTADGMTAQHLGAEDVEGMSCEKVLVKADDVEVTMWVDKDGTVVMDSYMGTTQQGPGKIERVYGDWREVGGVRLAHSLAYRFEGKDMQKLTLNEIEMNPAVAENEFNKPESAQN